MTTNHQEMTINNHKQLQTTSKWPQTTIIDHKSPANNHNKNKTKYNFSEFQLFSFQLD